MSTKILAFDHMVKKGLFNYSTDTWGSDTRTKNYESVCGLTGQVNCDGETFVVTHSKGGGCGMGAYPDSVNIIRIEPIVEPIKVIIIESEAGWGQRVDDIVEFDTREEAEAFVLDFNKDNNKSVTPSWYMYAYIDESDK